MPNDIGLGSWVRAGTMTGLVVSVERDDVGVFDPGERRLATVPRAQAHLLPSAAVRVTITVDLPLPHGVGEETLRRWLAALVDPVLQDRASTALRQDGHDAGPALPSTDVVLTPSPGSDAVCLCGHRTDAQGSARVECSACGRVAVVPPASSQL